LNIIFHDNRAIIGIQDKTVTLRKAMAWQFLLEATAQPRRCLRTQRLATGNCFIFFTYFANYEEAFFQSLIRLWG
jgi:hypothetical protein